MTHLEKLTGGAEVKFLTVGSLVYLVCQQEENFKTSSTK